MAEHHGGRVMAAALRECGVDTVFTLCGGHVSALLDGCLDVGIRVVDHRHEGAAALAAEGYALATGRTGFAAVTAGPGFANAFIALADASVWTLPLVLFAGRTPAALLGRGSVADLDQRAVAATLAKHTVACRDPGRIADAVREAFHTARVGRPGCVYLEVAKDLLGAPAPESPAPPESAYPQEPPRPTGARGDLDRALSALEAAERPIVLAGGGALWSGAGEQLGRFADISRIPVTTTGAARGLLPDSHPLCLGSMIHAGAAVACADVVLVLGSAFNANVLYGRPPLFAPGQTVIQVDIDGASLGGARCPEIAVIGDVANVLDDLSATWRKAAPGRDEWLDEARRLTEFVRATWDRQVETHHGERIHAGAATREVVVATRELVGDDVTFVADGGDALSWALAYTYAEGPGRVLTTTTALGTLGVGVPFAIAAAVARNEPVVLFAGDGAFGFAAMEIDTAARHRLPIICVVSNNRGWRDVSKGQDERYGRRVASDLADTRYDLLGTALGGHGELVSSLDELRPAFTRALERAGPTVINVQTDTEVVSELMANMGDLNLM